MDAPKQYLNYITLNEYKSKNIKRISGLSYIADVESITPYKDWEGWIVIRFLYAY
jgi:hypothetical protein